MGERSGWRHFKALMWKNWLLKRRNLCSTCCELLLPVAFVLLMVGLYRAFSTNTFATQDYSNPWGLESLTRGLSPQAERVVPFSVTPYRLSIQNQVLAVVPGSPAMQPVVDAFIADMTARYPPFPLGALDGGNGVSLLNPALNNITIPGFAAVVTTFASVDAMTSYIKSPDYATGQGASQPSIWAAIVFNSGPPAWDYSLRFNTSVIPSTREAPTDNLERGSDPANIKKYVYTQPPQGGNPFSRNRNDAITALPFPGFMTLQTMVDRWILNQSSPLPTVPPLNPFNPGPSVEAITAGAAGRFANAMQFCLTYMLSPFESTALFAEWQNSSVTSLPRLVNLFNGFIEWGAPEAYAPQQIDLVRFPITAYQSNDFYDIAQSVLAFFLTITLLFPVSRLIRGLVAEKETKIREGMKMMGLSDAALLGSWVATYALMFLIISVLITIVSATSIFRSSNKGLIFITFWLYGWSCIFFSYFISVFFSRAKTASTLGVVLFLGGFFPYFGLAAPEYSFETKTAASILSPTAFGFALDIIASYENSGVGAVPSNLLVIERNFSLSRALGMLFADCLLYWFLGWYIDNTLPARFREFGVPRPWYFPVSGSYWREVFNIEPKSAAAHGAASADTSSLLPPGAAGAGAPGAASEPATPIAAHGVPAPAPGTHTEGGGQGVTAMLRTAAAHLHASRKHNGPPTDPSFIEPLDASLRAKEREGKAVLLAGLRKEFSTPDGIKVAVDDISLSMHEGQITCLLGHNGAGKSTTISMLCGLIPPTDGAMTVFGRDVSTNLASIRRDLGVCPQHDVLWPELTVSEHLLLFAAIKGVPYKDVKAEVDRAIREIGLTEKRHTYSRSLSGGQKRKLSCAIALLGGSRVVVLDEPTSGMDPYSRRSTWEALQNARAGRVIILTTHFMDEADLLGDRIAIMAQGQVKCSGSSMFLKKLYGVGYVLTIVKRHAADVDGIVALLRGYVPETAVATNVGAELCLRLPLSSSALFPAMFGALDAAAHGLGVGSYGISVTTMEDVFLRVAHGDEPTHAAEAQAAAAATQAARASTVVGGGGGARVVPEGGAASDPTNDGVDHHHALAPASSVVGYLKNPAAALSGKGLKGSSTSSSTAPGGDATVVKVAAPSAGAGAPADDDDGGDGEVETGTEESLAKVRAAARKVDGSAWRLFAVHFRALFLKRWHNTKRDSKAFCYQLLIPAIMLAVGLGLIKLTLPGDFPSVAMTPAPLNANRRANAWAQAGPNYVPYYGYRSGNISAAVDDPGLAAFFETMPQGSLVTNDSAMLFDVAEAAAIPNTYGFVNSSAPYPQQDWQRLSSWLIADKPAYKWSKYGGYIVTDQGTYYPGQAPVGGSPGVFTYTALHNTTFVHGGPTFVNLMHTRLLQAVSGAAPSDPGAPSIAVSNWPLPFTLRQANLFSSIVNFGAAIIIVIAYSFIPASQVQFIVREREVNAKYQQIISGVSLPAYWLANYLYDIIAYIVPCGLAIALIAAFNIQEWISTDLYRVNAVIGTFALYGVSVTASTYLLSWLFKSYSTASNVVLMLNLGASFVTIVAHTIMRYIDVACRFDQRALFIWRLIPGFNLGNVLLDLSFLTYLGNIENQCDIANGASPLTLSVAKYNALSLPAAGWSMIYLAVTAVVWLAAAIGIDFYMAKPALRQRCSRPPVVVDEPLVDEDEDVVAERARVASQLSSGHLTDVILLDNLRKVYPPVNRKSRAKVAVRGLSYGVPVGQVFAFLGINGAGKSTTLSMLSGDTLPSSGDARLAGYDILTQQPEVRRLLGYCPQFDALLELMTCREHLELYARIKGVKESELEEQVQTKLKEFDLTAFENKKAGTLSGGNKRKLSVAIATIGNPQIIFLDEPSTGVDPVARRFMWSVISRIATEQKNASIILTTHSMEEVQALAQRVGIMVGGRLRCLGSIQHLKHRFGRGYQLEVKLDEARREDVAAIANAVVDALGPAASSSSTGAATGPMLPRSRLRAVCDALGNGDREAAVHEGGTGWAVAAGFDRSTTLSGIQPGDKTIPVADFAAWWGEEDAAEALRAYICDEAFPGAELLERQGSQLRFKLPPLTEPLGALFAKIEAVRSRLGVQGYSCGQTSLEQIFNYFAAQQEEETGHARGMVASSASAAGAGGLPSPARTSRQSSAAGGAGAVAPSAPAAAAAPAKSA